MHLKSINLAGFKSFVDPTTVDLRSDVNVVVGPNGCGKSNILDAIRWVVGESSAQRLRGEVNSDLIFDGSASRPPSARASVELIFDNTSGRVGGEYAAYAELSVRREVTSESQSSYYLNGQRCRRRDVQDVFLGTGFGTRGYSIVQQDLISQLVNSNPDTLREHLEEAAGISKYRARRHETLNNINRTNSNLEQIRISVNELDREIRQLKRQATQARRYQKLEVELRSLRQILLSRQLSEKQTEKSGVEAKLTDIDDQLSRLNDSITSNASRISLLEETRSRQQQERDTTSQAKYQADATMQSLETRIKEIDARRTSNENNIEDKIVQLRESLRLLDSDIAREERATTTKSEALQRLESESRVVDEVSSTLEDSNKVAQAAIDENQSLSRQQTDQQTRHDKLLSEIQFDRVSIKNLEQLIDTTTLTDFDVSAIEDNISEYEALVNITTQSRDALEIELSQITEAIGAKQEERLSTQHLLTKWNSDAQEIRDELLALQTLHQATLGQTGIDEELDSWLRNNNLTDKRRIGELIDVEAGWERTIEIVLGSKIRAIETTDLDALLPTLNQISRGEVLLYVESGSSDNTSAKGNLLPLSSKLQGSSIRFGPLFRGIYCADSLEEALEARQQLAVGESVTTAGGAWIASNWIWKFQETDEGSGVIGRERRIEELVKKLEQAEKDIEANNALIDELDVAVQSMSTERERLFSRLSELSNTHTEQSTMLREYSKQLRERNQARESRERMSQERHTNLRELHKRVESNEKLVSELTDSLNILARQVIESEKKSQTSRSLQQEHQERFEVANRNRREVEFDLRQIDATLEHIAGSKSRQDRVVAQTVKDLRMLIEDDELAKEEVPGLHRLRNEKTEERDTLSEALNQVNSRLQETDKELTRIRDSQSLLNETKDQLNDTLLQQTSRMNRLAVELEQLQLEIKNLGIPESEEESDESHAEISSAEIEEEISGIEDRLSRLGLINYRANEELEAREKNREDLAMQVKDLEEGLATLESSIKRIDTETVKSMQETFDETNKNLDRVFRTLFGGGSARLELTEPDILLAGIQVRAQPPGKRNTTITSLSGGERAMTAIAFIFALFDLNPSPVCVLDEVDAPLDERNVVKFTELLAQMSVGTQFVIITHNPATMELAGNLLGVTMEEAGVSRIVSVNLEDAYQMAGNQVESVAVGSV